MSALDDVLDAGESCDWVMPEEHDAALAELALLRRCRDAVAGLPDNWAEDRWYDVRRCRMCQRTLFDACGQPGEPHSADCPALAIDALAKEVRGE